MVIRRSAMRRQAVTLLVAIVLSWIMAGLAGQSIGGGAHQIVPNWRYQFQYYYYSDASYTTEVGYRFYSQCTGEDYREGVQTQFVISDRTTCTC